MFLAGSIEMGKARDWQAELAAELDPGFDYVLNPRRDEWDPRWEQSLDNDEFVGQVNWELDGLKMSTLIIFYLQAGTKSPISLMELGLCADVDGEVVVVCEDGFWRKGNVEILCQRAGIQVLPDMTALYQHLGFRGFWT